MARTWWTERAGHGRRGRGGGDRRPARRPRLAVAALGMRSASRSTQEVRRGARLGPARPRRRRPAPRPGVARRSLRGADPGRGGARPFERGPRGLRASTRPRPCADPAPPRCTASRCEPSSRSCRALGDAARADAAHRARGRGEPRHALHPELPDAAALRDRQPPARRHAEGERLESAAEPLAPVRARARARAAPACGSRSPRTTSTTLERLTRGAPRRAQADVVAPLGRDHATRCARPPRPSGEGRGGGGAAPPSRGHVAAARSRCALSARCAKTPSLIRAALARFEAMRPRLARRADARAPLVLEPRPPLVPLERELDQPVEQLRVRDARGLEQLRVHARRREARGSCSAR